MRAVIAVRLALALRAPDPAREYFRLRRLWREMRPEERTFAHRAGLRSLGWKAP